MKLRVKSMVQAVVFLGLIAVALPYLASRWFDPAAFGLAWRVAGALVGAAGLALSLWCIVLFVRVGEGTQSPRQPPKNLVTEGPYAAVRNPMLVGVTLLLVGEAAAFASLGIAVYALAFLAVTNVLMLTVEEPSLRRRFGAEYEAYRRQVPRWVPRLIRRPA
jgi:protein-S-isoprenylcysteine O-methyltransferase Ste14